MLASSPWRGITGATHLNAGSLPKKVTKTMKERDRTKTTAHLNGVMSNPAWASRARPPALRRKERGESYQLRPAGRYHGRVQNDIRPGTRARGKVDDEASWWLWWLRSITGDGGLTRSRRGFSGSPAPESLGPQRSAQLGRGHRCCGPRDCACDPHHASTSNIEQERPRDSSKRNFIHLFTLKPAPELGSTQ